MTKIYVVMGSTGEYSDGREWMVAAYTDEEKAKTHVELANARVRELGISFDDDSVLWQDRDKFAEAMKPLDDQCQVDYTGTGYHLVDVDLLDEVPGKTEDA
jgi:hypothetical protein